MVENLRVDAGISLMSHSCPEIVLIVGLPATIAISGCRLTSGTVSSTAFESGMVENVGMAAGISLICQYSPKIRRAFGLQAAILMSGCWPTSGSIGSTTRLVLWTWSKMWGKQRESRYFAASLLILR